MELIGKKTSVVEKDNELSIVISASANKSSSYIVLCWLLCFSVCGVIIISQYFTTNEEKFKVFLIVFGGFWAYFELRALYAFFWKRFGKEVIKVKEGQFFLKRAIFSRGKIAVYDPIYIKNIRIKKVDHQTAFSILSSIDWLTGSDSIAFDYYGKEITLGFMLEPSDSQQLVKLLIKQIR